MNWSIWHLAEKNNYINKFYKYICKNKLTVVMLLLYLCFIFLNKNFYMFHTDEFHAYVIAKRFGFIDIIKLMRAEGHTFVWFLLIKLIPNHSPFFPYGLKCLSALFAFLSICLLWFKSPFNHYIKILITLSFPMLNLYPIIARPYSLGIMLIFLLAALYKKRLEHPVWFSIIILLTANTSLMAAVGAFSFSLIFLYDLIKDKNKNLAVSVFILAMCALILYIQWHDPIIPNYTQLLNINDLLFHSFEFEILTKLSYYILPGFVILSSFYLRKNLKLLFFFWSNTVILTLIFTLLYSCGSYHHYFIYIYWIVSYWLMGYEKNLNSNKYILISFIILNLLFYTPFCKNFSLKPYTHHTNYIENIVKNIPAGSTIYTTLNFSNDKLWLYKNKLNYDFRTYDNSYLYDFNNFLNLYNHNYENGYLDEIIKNAPTNSYIIVNIENRELLSNPKNQQALYKIAHNKQLISIESICGSRDIIYKIK